MTVTDHLTELRGRIIKSVIAVAVGVAFCAWQIDDVVAFLTSPVERLYVMKPAEAFLIYMKIALWSGVIAASPVLFYQLWAFLLPAFTRHEKKGLLLLFPCRRCCFRRDFFSFFIVLPQGLRFFMSFAMESVQPLWSLAGYLDFAVLMVLPFGVIFNLPVALVVLARMGLVSSIQLKSFRKYVIVISFAIAAVITPTTDILSQCLLAMPMIVLLEISRLIIKYGLRT